jgi:hypothetical protein
MAQKKCFYWNCKLDARFMGDYIYCDECLKKQYTSASTKCRSSCGNVKLNKCLSIRANAQKIGKFHWLLPGKVTYDVHPNGMILLNNFCTFCYDEINTRHKQRKQRQRKKPIETQRKAIEQIFQDQRSEDVIAPLTLSALSDILNKYIK